jgi:hypothetical protein
VLPHCPLAVESLDLVFVLLLVLKFALMYAEIGFGFAIGIGILSH